MKIKNIIGCLGIILSLVSCEKDKKNPILFSKISPTESGIEFSNDLSFDQKFNVYTYRNYYNGGGVAIGDINNDSLPDIYMTANLKSNKLFLNKGDLKFEDITENAGTSGTRAWSTGVTMVDINADGFLDIYVCNSGDIAGDNKQNELFINNGNLTFTESAEEYNLADKGFSTHASFFDFDKDGDLDVYILNNSYQSIASFDLRRNERPKRDTLGGDKLMENVGGKFVDISEKAGIYGSVIGFGLGVTVGDVNGDSWDDIYVSNDFFERDYLYLNNQDGTFREELTAQMKSISGASMGADMADINNDGKNDLFVTEMLPSDYQRLKSVTTFEDWNRYQYSVKNGYYHQFTRNTFQLNNGDDTFHELSRMAGVDASDWSWGALIFDMDNDGLKDLFIANGIYQDLTNQDYLQYVSNEEVAKSIISNEGVDYKKLIDIIPSNPISNHAFKNKDNLQFEDQTEAFGLEEKGFSNGSAYADLDNDGDLDLVVNNVNMSSWLYRNNSEKRDNNNYLQFELEGEKENKLAIGAKIFIKGKNDNYYIEQQPIRGFQSSMDPRPHVGLKSDEVVDVKVIWSSLKETNLKGVKVNQVLKLAEKDGENVENPAKKIANKVFQKVEKPNNYKHLESNFVDFHRDRLIYHMNSTEGPKMSKGDVNGDGFEDLFIGGSKKNSASILLGSKNGFINSNTIDFDKEGISEDTESALFDADGDGDLDLYVCSGGVELSQSSSALIDRLYLNDGKGNFEKSKNNLKLTSSFVSSSTVSASDIDKDGDLDLFVGERAKPTKYGIPGSGFILQNNKGVFTDISVDVAPDLKEIGMIKDSEFVDLDGDGDDDLIVTGEFMGIHIFLNNSGKFEAQTNNKTENLKGWWNTIHAADIDGDGDMDLIVGNHGLNSRFKASVEEPISLFLKDFDENSSIDPILGKYAANGKAYPYALRHNLIDQIKSLKKLFPDYKSFQNASIQDIFSEEVLAETTELKVNILSTILLKNNGNMDFEVVELPQQAQLTPIYAISSGDYDKDGDLDLLLGGNLYGTKPEVGRYDASYGSFLVNDGNGNFKAASSDFGFFVDGEIREILTLERQVVVGVNSDSLSLFNY